MCKKSMQCWHMYSLHHAWWLETFQGVTVDSLGAVTIKNMHLIITNIAMKCRSAFWQCRQCFCIFSIDFCGRRVLGCCLFIPVDSLLPEGLKKELSGFCPPMYFGSFCASGVKGVIWQWRGVIDENGTDVEAAEKCCHVPAMSSDSA